MAPPRHPHITNGVQVYHRRSESDWRARRRVLKSIRRQGKTQAQAGLTVYELQRDLRTATRDYLYQSVIESMGDA